jgi:hypothetical protein
VVDSVRRSAGQRPESKVTYLKFPEKRVCGVFDSRHLLPTVTDDLHLGEVVGGLGRGAYLRESDVAVEPALLVAARRLRSGRGPRTFEYLVRRLVDPVRIGKGGMGDFRRPGSQVGFVVVWGRVTVVRTCWAGVPAGA